MKISLPFISAETSRGALDGATTLAFLVSQGEPEPLLSDAPSGDLFAAYGVDLPSTLELLKVTGKVGEVRTLTLPPLAADDRWAHLPATVLFVGVGPTSGSGVGEDFRRAGAALARALAPESVAAVAGFSSVEPAVVTAFSEGVLLGSYRHPAIGTKERPAVAEAARLVDATEPAVKLAVRRAKATVKARAWAATPSNIKNPEWMAQQARNEGKKARVNVRVYDEKWIRAQGMGGLSAVGGGSATPPRFVVVEYTPKGKKPGEIVVVGKGITYDTGGLDIKPREGMVPMKTDMSGSAIALAAVLAAAKMEASNSIVAVLPFAENAVSGSAFRPSDVVTMFDGTTVEIGNTDAEGRMVLADGMGWALAEYSPSLIIDVATLTGAATLGLGKFHAALYATTDGLAQAFIDSGLATGEPVWRMPLVEEYRSSLDSDVADINHIAAPGVGGGSITAALFLQHFAGDTPWVHLDIAGPGRATKDGGIYAEGATGYTARLLVDFLTGDPLASL